MLEGRECGGHVGPRSSFVLWEQAVALLSAMRSTGAYPPIKSGSSSPAEFMMLGRLPWWLPSPVPWRSAA